MLTSVKLEFNLVCSPNEEGETTLDAMIMDG